MPSPNTTTTGPTLTYDLNEGERIMLRRALVLYEGHFRTQLAQHRKEKNEYDVQFDVQRIGAIHLLSEKILKEGRRS